jgi:hypothetical protein
MIFFVKRWTLYRMRPLGSALVTRHPNPQPLPIPTSIAGSPAKLRK